MNPTSLNPTLSEGSSATLTVVLLFMTIGALLRMCRMWSECQTFSEFYDETRSTVAFGTFVGAFGVRTGVIWWQRYEINHGIAVSWDGWVSWTLLIATIVATLGGMCWLRETFPDLMGRKAWIAATAFAFACGIASVAH